MRVKYRTWCRVPVDSALIYEVEECELVETLPFTPAVGQRLKVTPNGQHQRVSEVLWDMNDPRHLVVWFEEPASRVEMPWAAAMQSEGWRVCS